MVAVPARQLDYVFVQLELALADGAAVFGVFVSFVAQLLELLPG